MSAKRIYTVTQVNRYVKGILEDDALLNGFFVTGELSNVRIHTSGHIYFSLKDENAAVSAVMFKSYAYNLAFTPENGMEAVIFGRISLYEKTGQYQLYAEFMEPAGVGGLQTAFTQLRDKLQAEGLFDEARKKALPEYAFRVALITSPTGAAVRDMIRVIREKNPTVKIIIAPALVQGRDAAEDIARAIREVNEWGEADVIILGRGGGSAEDLWAFNEETTVRAVAASKIPVISAVGHETDFTITDFAADTRAPTPTAAADTAVFDLAEAMGYVKFLMNGLTKAAKRLHMNKKDKWLALRRSSALRRPLQPIYDAQVYINGLLAKINAAAINKLRDERAVVNTRAALLEKNSPYAAWKRGFALVRDESGAAVTDSKSVKPGMKLTLKWTDRTAKAEVTEVHIDSHKPVPYNQPS